MADKMAVKIRLIKMRYFIAMGLRPVEVQKKLEISRRTYYRYILELQKEHYPEHMKAYYQIKILEMRDDLLRDLMRIRARARTDELFIDASIAAGQVLSALEKDFERFGLIPPEKKIIRIYRKN
ncbi:MAG TPA: hypothetical protein VK158_01290 [Acidobacteriota bacterium]|nr:hypothetical protein [Acidobacteriota bacterium]